MLNRIFTLTHFNAILAGLATWPESMPVPSPAQADCRNLRKIGSLYKQYITQVFINFLDKSGTYPKIGAYQTHTHYADKDPKERNHGGLLHLYRVYSDLALGIVSSQNNEHRFRIILVKVPSILNYWYDCRFICNLFDLGNFGNSHALPNLDIEAVLEDCRRQIDYMIDNDIMPLTNPKVRKNFRLWLQGL